jgi:hypothetical protein
MIDLNTFPVKLPNPKTINVLAAMGPADQVPDIYNDAYRSGYGSTLRPASLTTITFPHQIAGFLSQWFFKGLISAKFNLKPDAVVGGEDAFKVFVASILQSRAPAHEHKMAFLTWTIHTCCESVTYQVR